jgi:hypothetical protein
MDDEFLRLEAVGCAAASPTSSDSSRRWLKWRWSGDIHRIIAVSAVVLAIGSLVGTAWTRHWFGHAPSESSVSIGQGPMEAQPPNGWDVSMAVGTRFANAWPMLILHGTKPAVITSITVKGPLSPGLKVLGFMLAGPGVGNATEYRGWPPHGQTPTRKSLRATLQPAIGAVVRPQRYGYDLLIGYQRETNQVATQRAVVVGYRVGEHRYQVTLASRFIACPPTMTQAQCSKVSDRLYPAG